MKKIFVLMIITATVIASGCSNSGKKDKNGLADLKKQLETKKKEKTKVETEIKTLEQRIAKLDTNAALQQNRALVSVQTLQTQDFTHYIDLQGKVDADNIVVVTPRGMPAQVKQLYVKRGDLVKQGQLLAKLDDAVMLQQMDGLKTQLAFAENIYNRQKNLWDQGIGTEVQLITAKNNVDAINKQIATLQETWKTSFVYAPTSGLADVVDLKQGEIFSGMTATGPQIRIVNTSSMKVVTEVPENYQKRVAKGSRVEISIPDIGKSFSSVIKVTGATINPTTRGYITEAKIPSDPALRVNQVALVKIQDYASKNTIVVPVNVVQTDEKNKYVYVMVKEGNRTVARKKIVDTGETFNSMTEIKSGLNVGDQLITDGYQQLYDGQTISTS